MQKLKSRQVSGVTPELTPKVWGKFRCYTKLTPNFGVKPDLNPAHDGGTENAGLENAGLENTGIQNVINKNCACMA